MLSKKWAALYFFRPKIFLFAGIWAMICQAQLSAQDAPSPSVCCGKLDVGGAYVHLDILNKGVTHHRVDLPAIKADVNYNVWKGILIKPSVIYGSQGNSTFATGGVGLGFCGRIDDCLTITPCAGINWTYIRTQFKEKVATPLGVPHPKFHERFRSRSPYLSLEVSYKFLPQWRIVGCFQYSWSRTHTHLRGIFPQEFRVGAMALGQPDPGSAMNYKSNTKGPSYSGMLEYDINDHWSVNVGAAYNVSLSKEKHGIRGYGYKLGLAYWF